MVNKYKLSYVMAQHTSYSSPMSVTEFLSIRLCYETHKLKKCARDRRLDWFLCRGDIPEHVNLGSRNISVGVPNVQLEKFKISPLTESFCSVKAIKCFTVSPTLLSTLPFISKMTESTESDWFKNECFSNRTKFEIGNRKDSLGIIRCYMITVG